MKRNWIVTIRRHSDFTGKHADDERLVENATFEEVAAIAASKSGSDVIGPPGPQVCIGSREVVCVRMTDMEVLKP